RGAPARSGAYRPLTGGAGRGARPPLVRRPSSPGPRRSRPAPGHPSNEDEQPDADERERPEVSPGDARHVVAEGHVGEEPQPDRAHDEAPDAAGRVGRVDDAGFARPAIGRFLRALAEALAGLARLPGAEGHALLGAPRRARD